MYYYKIFEAINFLLQQRIYHCIKFVIKIYEFITIEFFVAQSYYLRFYCNTSSQLLQQL